MSLPRSTPSAQGVDATGLLALVDAAERDHLGLHSLMVVRHGHVVAEGWWRPYAASRVHLAYSLSKTVTATAVGFLVQEGRLSLDDRVLDHFPELDRSAVSPGWEDVRVRHCLSMTVGHEQDAWSQVFDRMSGSDFGDTGDWVPRVFATTPTRTPGTVFAYNQVATYLLSVIVGRVAGVGVAEVLRPRLLAPLGLPDIPWHRDPAGRELGFTGSHLTTEAIASIAQLYLDRGRWQGRQLLSEAWVDEATRAFGPLNEDPGADDDWRRGYGYSFWMQRVGYRGDGAYGQFLVVLPEHDTVVAITAEQSCMQATLDLLWEHLVPAIGRGGPAGSGESEAADRALAERLAGLEIPAMSGDALGPDHAEFSRASASDLAADYTAVSVTRDGADFVLGLNRRGEWLRVPVGRGLWREGEIVAGGATLPVVASGGWVDEDTFRAEVIAIESPHRFRIEARLRSSDADLTWRMVPLTGYDPLWLATRWSYA
ncbi:serine hydrolase domain-containing protein [Terrabacter sp. C0L_2]|uniref:serine hydrolase domain-containing protein n=1 Tax=Terrabacter sp. C0L_2 TaxID=3108389 RepID=UPI002ED2C392|nr:serine hydrolase domain-containing protein [Terrabacter sp. C0L_2]